jgi:hypothetical protein
MSVAVQATDKRGRASGIGSYRHPRTRSFSLDVRRVACEERFFPR